MNDRKCRICGNSTTHSNSSVCSDHRHLVGVYPCKICEKLTRRAYCSDKCREKGINQVDKVCDKCGSQYVGNIRSKLCFDCSPNAPKYKLSRFIIFQRDDFKCVYCGKSSIEDGLRLVIEHVSPEYTVENNKLTNLVTSCWKCNMSKNTSILNKDIVDRIVIRNKELMKNWPENIINEMELFFSKFYSK